MNGYWDCFEVDPEHYEKSAAAIHAYTAHEPPLNLSDFKCTILEQCSHSVKLNREEFKCIEKYRTNTKGLNRCKVTK